MKTHQRIGRRRGIVLLVVLSILAILSVLAMAFVKLAALEKTMSRNYVERTRALIVAESGVEYAISRLRAFEGGASAADEAEDLRFAEHPSEPGLLHATKASFQQPGYGYPVSGFVAGTAASETQYFILNVRSESGKLNINDTNGRWNIDTDPYDDSVSPWKDEHDDAPRRLSMLVETLSDFLFGDPVLASVVSIHLFQARAALPGDRFESMDQVRAALVDTGVLTDDQYDAFRREVTLYSWQDPDTLRPSFQVHISVPAGDTGLPPDNFDVYMYRDAQTRGYEIEPRCPVNLNDCSDALLYSALTNLQGWYVDEGDGLFWTTFPNDLRYAGTERVNVYKFFSNRLQYFYKDQNPVIVGLDVDTKYRSLYGSFQTTELPVGIRRQLVIDIQDRIHAQGKPFQTWQDFHRFLADRVEDPMHPDMEGSNVLGGFTRAMADLVMAQFNPNSQLNDFNPNADLFRLVDKAQLTKYSTEFCLQSTGPFAVESLGVVRDDDGVMLAQCQVECMLDLFYPFRVTTQAQFMKGMVVDDATRGEAAYFSPGGLGLLPCAGAGKNSPDGLSLQCYPEPVIDADSAPFWAANPDRDYAAGSRFEGYLMPATHQFDPAGAGGITFTADFNRTLEPAVWQTLGNPYTKPVGAKNEPLFGTFSFAPTRAVRRIDSHAHRLTTPVEEPDMPGALYPDGAYSEVGRPLRYRATNFGEFARNGFVGSVEFWIKPNFDAAYPQRPRQFAACPEYVGFHSMGGVSLYYFGGTRGSQVSWPTIIVGSGVRVAVPQSSMLFGWCQSYIGAGDTDTRTDPSLQGFYNSYYSGTDSVNHEWHTFADMDPALPNFHQFASRRWNHVSFNWNMLELNLNNPKGYVSVNGSVATLGFGAHEALPWTEVPQGCREKHMYFAGSSSWGSFPPQDAAWCSFGGKYGRVGIASTSPESSRFQGGYSADSTYDDIVSHDYFLSHPALTAGYAYGRYNSAPNVDDVLGEYTSPEWRFKPQGDLRLHSVSWTLWWPLRNRQTDSNIEDQPLQAVDYNTVYADDPVVPSGLDAVAVDVAVDGVWHYEHAALQGLLPDARSAMPTFAGGSRLLDDQGRDLPFALDRNAAFQFRISFLLEDGQTVYDAPALDDITFLFEYAKPRFLYYKLRGD